MAPCGSDKHFTSEAAESPTGSEVDLQSGIYKQLLRLAHNYMSGERLDHTLQTTALVNEAYLRLAPQSHLNGLDRSHFINLFTSAMREVLVDHARHRNSLKRGGNWQQIPLSQALLLFEESSLNLLELDEALQRLSVQDPRVAHIVELRFFGGLAEEQIASLLDLSIRTVRREWRFGRLWLKRELASGEEHVD